MSMADKMKRWVALGAAQAGTYSLGPNPPNMLPLIHYRQIVSRLPRISHPVSPPEENQK